MSAITEDYGVHLVNTGRPKLVTNTAKNSEEKAKGVATKYVRLK